MHIVHRAREILAKPSDNRKQWLDRLFIVHAAFSGMWDEFLTIVETGDRGAAQANVRQAYVDVATALAAYESATTSSWIKIAPAPE